MLDWVLNTSLQRNMFQNKVYDPIHFKYNQKSTLSIVKHSNQDKLPITFCCLKFERK